VLIHPVGRWRLRIGDGNAGGGAQLGAAFAVAKRGLCRATGTNAGLGRVTLNRRGRREVPGTHAQERRQWGAAMEAMASAAGRAPLGPNGLGGRAKDERRWVGHSDLAQTQRRVFFSFFLFFEFKNHSIRN
jgi:hypothetical protein